MKEETLKLAAKLLKEKNMKFEAKLDPQTGKYVGEMYDKNGNGLFLITPKDYKKQELALKAIKKEAVKILERYSTNN